jgi:plastocyanin
MTAAATPTWTSHARVAVDSPAIFPERQLMSTCLIRPTRGRLAGGLVAAGSLLALAGCSREPPRGPIPQESIVTEIRSQFMTVEAAPSETAAAQGTGWATLSGTIKLAGDPPPAKPLPIAGSDAGICAPGGATVLSRSLIVDKDSKGIANVVIFARKVARVNPLDAKPQTKDVEFDQKNCLFTEPLAVAQLGQTVVLKNSDPMAHNVKMRPASNPAFNQLIPSTQSTTYNASAEEGVPVQVNCDVHPWMKAFLFFRKNGYFAVTKADGSFEIPNLPAGEEIEFQIWHERIEKYAMTTDGTKIDAKGRFKLKLTADENKKLSLDIPVAALSE